MKKYFTWVLGVFCIIAFLALLDSFRPPSESFLVKGYVGAARHYQVWRNESPNYTKLVPCRLSPSCSEFSILAVQQHGLPKGLWLTVKRMVSSPPSAAPRSAPSPALNK